MLYEDLAGHAAFDGILFHDDALLSDYEDASAPAITAYQQAGFSGSLSEIRQNRSNLNSGPALKVVR